MMKKCLAAFLFALFTAGALQAQGIDFFHGTWKEALAKAQAEEKPIFMDAYAQWCGPCKRMAATTFKDEKVGRFFNENFVNLKIDWESPEATELRGKFPVSAYPSLFFINAKGDVIQKVVGGRDVEGLLQIAQAALGKADFSQDYEKSYNEGKRDPEMMYNYVRSLNKSGKPSLKIANDYLATQKDLTTPQNLRFILEAASEVDSRIFDLLIQYRDKITALSDEKTVRNRIERACMKTGKKAVEFQNKALLDQAISTMKKYCPDKADAFATMTTKSYCKASGDAEGYAKACRSEATENPDQLRQLAIDIEQAFGSNKNAMREAEKLARKSADKGNKYTHFYTYADILYKNGKKSDALKNAEKSLELAKKDNPPVVPSIEQLIAKIREN